MPLEVEKRRVECGAMSFDCALSSPKSICVSVCVCVLSCRVPVQHTFESFFSQVTSRQKQINDTSDITEMKAEASYS